MMVLAMARQVTMRTEWAMAGGWAKTMAASYPEASRSTRRPHFHWIPKMQVAVASWKVWPGQPSRVAKPARRQGWKTLGAWRRGWRGPCRQNQKSLGAGNAGGRGFRCRVGQRDFEREVLQQTHGRQVNVEEDLGGVIRWSLSLSVAMTLVHRCRHRCGCS
ncbi:hypothetical protein BCR44DRAFT_1432877, partial [Catenaria anguillulae PL171]